MVLANGYRPRVVRVLSCALQRRDSAPAGADIDRPGCAEAAVDQPTQGGTISVSHAPIVALTITEIWRRLIDKKHYSFFFK